MGHVRFGNAIRRVGADPPHNGAQVTKEVAVQRSERTAHEGKLGWTIMREQRVGVLQKRN